MWFATVGGKQIPLGVSDPGDQAGAWEALKQLVSGAVKEAISPIAGVKPGTVKQLVGEFLEFKKPHIKPRTLRGYGQYLG
jgi:hypothetical protein